MFIDLIKGIIVGLCASIPLGPIGVLCIQRTINRGRWAGFISGLGAATADTIFAACALLGLAYVRQIIDNYEVWFFIVGGILVAMLGLKIFLTNPIKQIRLRRHKPAKSKSVEDFVSVFFLTFSNPGAVFLMLGLFALVHFDTGEGMKNFNIALILWGVFIGAGLWWFSLSSLIDLFRKKFRIRQLWTINRVTGIVVFVLGIISVFQGLWDLLFKQLH